MRKSLIIIFPCSPWNFRITFVHIRSVEIREIILAYDDFAHKKFTLRTNTSFTSKYLLVYSDRLRTKFVLEQFCWQHIRNIVQICTVARPVMFVRSACVPFSSTRPLYSFRIYSPSLSPFPLHCSAFANMPSHRPKHASVRYISQERNERNPLQGRIFKKISFRRKYVCKVRSLILSFTIVFLQYYIVD